MHRRQLAPVEWALAAGLVVLLVVAVSLSLGDLPRGVVVQLPSGAAPHDAQHHAAIGTLASAIAKANPSAAPAVDAPTSAVVTARRRSLRDSQELLYAAAADAARFSRSAAAARGLVDPETMAAAVRAAVAEADMAHGQRDACIATAHGVPARQLAVFLGSLRQHNREADVFLLLLGDGTVPGEVATTAEVFDAVVVAVSEAALEPAFLRDYHFSTQRWVLADRFLTLHPRAYRSLLLVDARQSFFQSDPFALLSGAIASSPNLLLFRETDASTGAGPSLRAAAAALHSCYGYEALVRVSATGPPLSAAVVLGRAREVRGVARVMAEEVSSERFGRCEAEGSDQAAFNYILRSRLLDAAGVTAVREEGRAAGPVAVMQAGEYSLGGPSPRPLPLVLNGRGDPVAIAHQYDREHVLAAAVREKYASVAQNLRERSAETRGSASVRAAPKLVGGSRLEGRRRAGLGLGGFFRDDVAAEEVARLAGCEGYSLVEGQDIFWKVCDIVRSSRAAIRPSRCCEACDGEPRCRGFAWLGGICFLKHCSPPEGEATRRDAAGAVSGYRTEPL